MAVRANRGVRLVANRTRLLNSKAAAANAHVIGNAVILSGEVASKLALVLGLSSALVSIGCRLGALLYKLSRRLFRSILLNGHRLVSLHDCLIVQKGLLVE